MRERQIDEAQRRSGEEAKNRSGVKVADGNGSRPTLHVTRNTPYDPDWWVTQRRRQLWQRFRAEWRQIPYERRKGWFSTAGAGLLLTALMVVALTLSVRSLSRNGLLDAEADWLLWIVAFAPLSFEYSLYLGVFADTVFIISVVLAATLLAARVGRPLRAVSILASFIGSAALVGLGWLLWDRARPDLIHGGVTAPSFHSFPSGHTVEAIAVYGLFAYFWISATRHWGERILAGVIYLILILLVTLTRLELGAHWPSDILAAVLIGAFWLVALILAERRAMRRA